MKSFDFTEELTEFILANECKNGEEILVTLDGRKVCIAVPIINDDDIDIKVRPVR